MAKRLLFSTLLLLFLPAIASAQEQDARIIRGTVVEAKTGQPLPGASVFLDGTLRGTAADAKGRFRMQGIPDGGYKLVASMVGYEARTRKIIIPDTSQRRFQFKLPRATVKMRGVTVTGSREQWMERLERFKRAFLGTTPNAEECKIKNPEVLSFKVDAETGTLKSFTARPLQVANEALGYEFEYHLRRFEVREGGAFSRSGFGQFVEMKPRGPEENRQWKENRRRAYRGSFMHFVQSLAQGTLEEEGFHIYRTDSKNLRISSRGWTPVQQEGRAQRIWEESEIYERIGSSRMQLLFDGYKYLGVVYEDEPERQYVRKYLRRPESTFLRRPIGAQVSWIKPRGPLTVVDARSGRVYERFSPQLMGYWGWMERVANLLPRSYTPDGVASLSDPAAASPSKRSPDPAETARVTGVFGQCTAETEGYYCTLRIQNIHHLGASLESLPIRLTTLWPRALLAGTPPFDQSIEVVLQTRNVEDEAKTRWEVVRTNP